MSDPSSFTLVEIQFRKGSQAMYVKSDFNNEDYKEIHFFKESFVRSKHYLSFPQPQLSKRGIASKKKQGIINCLIGVTRKERAFWENLHVDESSRNLCAERDEGEKHKSKI